MNAADLVRDHVARWQRREFLPAMHDRLVRFLLRVEDGKYKIRDQSGTLVPFRPNEAQSRVLLKLLDQAAAARPLRLRILKGRKLGTSTLVQLLYLDLCAHWGLQRAATVAHETTATRDIFEIGRLAAREYSYLDGQACGDINEERIRFPCTDSWYRCRTAGGVEIESGGTPTLIHLSERPKWERNKSETYVSVTNAVPFEPLTCIIDEATAKGREEFYGDWEAGWASTGDHPFESIFLPWFLDDRLSAPVPDGFQRTDDERGIADAARSQGIELSDSTLQWRRLKVADIGPEMFRQEYPSTPQEAVQAFSGLILPNPRSCIVDTLPFVYERTPLDVRSGGIDFGYSTTDATVIWTSVYWAGTLYLIEMWRGFGTLAEEQVGGIRDGHRYWYDPAGLGAAKELNKAAILAGRRIHVAPAPRTRNVGEDYGSVEIHLLAAWMAKGRLKVFEPCATQFCIEADAFVWNEKTGKPRDSRGEAWGHFDSIFAAKYNVMGVDRMPLSVQRTVPAGHKTRRQQWARI